MVFTSLDQSLLGPFGTSASTFVGMGRNRIVNGDMQVDQITNGTGVTVSTATKYAIDRMICAVNASPTGVWTAQQISATPPAGFATYLHIVVTTPQASPSATQIACIETFLEGNMVNDFQYGLPGAVSAVLSFWVRSSLTGTFSGSVKNSATSGSLPFTYSIPVANTWTFVSIPVVGDTAHTLGSSTNASFQIVLTSLMVGSNFQGSATGAWQAGNYFGTGTGVNVLATNGATFDITGVQFEIGTVATKFESLAYAVQLYRCQRYYETGFVNKNVILLRPVAAGGDQIFDSVQFSTTKRINPTMTSTLVSMILSDIPSGGGSDSVDTGSWTLSGGTGSLTGFNVTTNRAVNTTYVAALYQYNWTASADF